MIANIGGNKPLSVHLAILTHVRRHAETLRCILAIAAWHASHGTRSTTGAHATPAAHHVVRHLVKSLHDAAHVAKATAEAPIHGAELRKGISATEQAATKATAEDIQLTSTTAAPISTTTTGHAGATIASAASVWADRHVSVENQHWLARKFQGGPRTRAASAKAR